VFSRLLLPLFSVSRTQQQDRTEQPALPLSHSEHKASVAVQCEFELYYPACTIQTDEQTNEYGCHTFGGQIPTLTLVPILLILTLTLILTKPNLSRYCRTNVCTPRQLDYFNTKLLENRPVLFCQAGYQNSPATILTFSEAAER